MNIPVPASTQKWTAGTWIMVGTWLQCAVCTPRLISVAIPLRFGRPTASDDAHVQLDAQRRRRRQLPVVVPIDERFVLVVQVRRLRKLP